MIKYIEKSARTEEDALAAALSELDMDRDDVTVEILERAKSGFLGIGASPAVIRVGYEVADEPEAAPAATPEPKPQPQPKPQAQAKAPAETAQPAPTAARKYSDDPLKAETEEFLIGLLSRMGINAELEITDSPNGGLLVNLSGAGMGAVIGRRGETLDAIQHLTNYAVNRGSDKRCHINVDAESYRAKREESLVHLAEKMAAKVVKYKRSMALEPMNSYERHVIHTALQNYEGVSTGSTGVEPNRRVVVSYEKPKAQEPQDNNPQSREWS